MKYISATFILCTLISLCNNYTIAQNSLTKTQKQYSNFELLLEWKIDSCGNSGILFNVVEDTKHEAVWWTGPEMQVVDNSCHPDAKIEKHRAGDLYG